MEPDSSSAVPEAKDAGRPQLPTKLLVANRGEIACRVLRAAAELGIETVAVYPSDDKASLHLSQADAAVQLAGTGAVAYLDGAEILSVALDHQCDAVHPGYGFLAENADFASQVEEAGLCFVGPTPQALAILGDKTRALDLALSCEVAVLASTGVLSSVDEAEAFVAEYGGAMLKAVAGGGGRGMRAVLVGEDTTAAYQRCQSEALLAFGDGALYAEQLVTAARHIEVQIVGDGTGAVTHLGERECTLQRQNQKILEYAPAPGFDPLLRDQLVDASSRMASTLRYRGLGTFEFLVDTNTNLAYFIEANARIQVEHTVTEEVTGVDLVQTQLAIAGGTSLTELGLMTPPAIVGQAVQARVNTEVMRHDGTAKPTGGTLDRFDLPSGVRVETAAYAGYTTSPSYDSLLVKVVGLARSGGLSAALSRVGRALESLRIEGVATNVQFLRALVGHPDVIANQITTAFVATEASGILEQLGPQEEATSEFAKDDLLGSGAVVLAPMQGTVLSLDVSVGDQVGEGSRLLIMEAMKMEHVIRATHSGVVRRIAVAEGEAVFEGNELVVIEPGDVDIEVQTNEQAVVDLDHIRPDLAEVNERHGFGLDENRGDSVDWRHNSGRRTARENLADLIDDNSLVEYGPLVVAAQRKRRSMEELMAKTPGDGMVSGMASVNGDLFGAAASQVVVMSYDYMVMAGTQGFKNHRKKDRLFELADQLKLPVVLFAEGGGGRPGDTEGFGVAGLDCLAFSLFAGLSGKVPLVGINGGYCFAGNAALLGCCDVIISTKDSYLGMGGPAMIEGGGLGVFKPTDVGPPGDQVASGVIDLLVNDEAEAVALAKEYLAYFQGPVQNWTVADQRELRHLIPENRLRIYEVRRVIVAMFDEGSVLELRQGFGHGMVTAFARVEGRTVGVIANDPTHLAGAIDSDGADKACRFMQLCDAFGIPIIFLCDTPGFMVGPEVERTGLVRHAARLFVTSASLGVPFGTIVLRKGYGLGAQAMAGGSFKAPVFTVGWPTSEFGGMGLEGAVKLGYRNELAAIEDPLERLAEYEQMVAHMYEIGKGTSMADHFEIDDVIDPASSRRWILMMLRASENTQQREGDQNLSAGSSGGRRRFVDTW